MSTAKTDPAKKRESAMARDGVVAVEDIEAAAKAIQGSVDVSPFQRSRKLSELSGATVFLKLENLQYTGSFKERGALNKMLALTEEERRNGVIAQSAGNHAQGVACHAERLGIPVVIVMPQHTPNVKVERTRSFGAEVIIHGETFDETTAYANELANDRGLTHIPPYDDPYIIAGQGTVGLEMMEAEPDLDTIVVPIGGGGLMSGIALAARARRPDIRLIGVQTERFPSMYQAVRGEPITCGQTTIAEGIAVKQPGRLTLPIIRREVDDILLVSEAAIEEAVQRFLQLEKLVAEGAGAAGLAALLSNKEQFEGQKVGVVIGGGNIDMLILSSIIQRGLARGGRLIRIRVEVRDVPGSLADVLTKIAAAGGNVVEVQHQRTFTTLEVQSTEIEIVMTTRGGEHVREIIAMLQEVGVPATLVNRAE